MFEVNISFSIFSVEEGKNKNWLRFTAFIDYLDNNTKYSFDYCGTEIHHSVAVTDKVIERLKEQLNNDFGYPPFNIRKCKNILGNGKRYLIPIK